MLQTVKTNQHPMLNIRAKILWYVNSYEKKRKKCARKKKDMLSIKQSHAWSFHFENYKSKLAEITQMSYQLHTSSTENRAIINSSVLTAQ